MMMADWNQTLDVLKCCMKELRVTYRKTKKNQHPPPRLVMRQSLVLGKLCCDFSMGHWQGPGSCLGWMTRGLKMSRKKIFFFKLKKCIGVRPLCFAYADS